MEQLKLLVGLSIIVIVLCVIFTAVEAIKWLLI